MTRLIQVTLEGSFETARIQQNYFRPGLEGDAGLPGEFGGKLNLFNVYKRFLFSWPWTTRIQRPTGEQSWEGCILVSTFQGIDGVPGVKGPPGGLYFSNLDIKTSSKISYHVCLVSYSDKNCLSENYKSSFIQAPGIQLFFEKFKDQRFIMFYIFNTSWCTDIKQYI